MATVLVVEDDVVTGDLYAGALRAHGEEVLTAESGAAALAIAATRHFDALVIDLRMPVMNGEALLERLRQQGVDTPAIMVTGDYLVDDATVARLRRFGVDLQFKPLWVDDLLAIVEKLLKGPRPGS